MTPWLDHRWSAVSKNESTFYMRWFYESAFYTWCHFFTPLKTWQPILPYFSTFMNFFPDSVSANTTLAYFNGFRLSKADVFSWNPFKKTSVYLVETSAEPGKDINDFWRGKFPKNKCCLFVCLILGLGHFKFLCIYGCI